MAMNSELASDSSDDGVGCRQWRSGVVGFGGAVTLLSFFSARCE